ncbi:hypothetical protein LTR85_001110 [Meristemomyces frigidus]|nr:hypothetical protein LTR85_001110 [Meristemomyces frigidus]
MKSTLKRLVKLPIRLIPKTKKIIRRMSSAGPTEEFHKFFELPRELRDEVYEYYFSGNIGLSSSNQPSSRNASAILLANKQLHGEARPIIFKQAVFTINLSPKYARLPGRDLAYYMDHRLTPGELFAGSKTVFSQFKHIHLTLDSPRSGTKGAHWQQAVATLLTTVLALPMRRKRMHISINLGNLNPGKNSTTQLVKLASRAYVHHNFKELPAAKRPSRDGLTDEQLEARGTGRAWAERTKPKYRERFCRLSTMYYLGQLAHVSGAEMRLESSDRQTKRVVTVDTVWELLKLAEGLDDGKEVWLVVEKED